MTERNDVRGFRTGRKNSLKIFIALLFALFFVLFCGNMTTVHAESKAKGQIVMSIEKATIGQGFIMEPQHVIFTKVIRWRQLRCGSLQSLEEGTITMVVYRVVFIFRKYQIRDVVR